MAADKKRVALEEEVLRLASAPGEHDRLVANKCKKCNLVFFPKRHHCAKCAGTDLVDVNLSPTGTLKSFAVVHQKPRFAQIDPPYIVGEVAMPEGVAVYAAISGDAKDLKMGMPVELVTEKVRDDEAGNEVVAYKFKPAKK